MSVELLLLTADKDPGSVLPALALLPYRLRAHAPEPGGSLDLDDCDVILIDARSDLVAARAVCRLVSTPERSTPIALVINEGGLVAVNGEWRVDEILLPTTGPAELDARLRLALARRDERISDGSSVVIGDLMIDDATYTARLRGRALDLTYKEFELLKYLTQHAGRVYTRARLLQEVWGYDFFGGTRTVDVHIRRLRAKLGPEHEGMIGTVRNVGYKFVPPRTPRRPTESPARQVPDSVEITDPLDVGRRTR